MSGNCAQLHEILRGLKRHSFQFDPAAIPRNGLYVVFEKGEVGHGGDRIVRIGTHTGEGQLRPRLRQHFLTPKKDRSIFRKNIGRALLMRDHDSFIEQWNFDLTTSEAKVTLGPLVDREKQEQVEHQVSAYMNAQFEFVVFPVHEKTKRLELEGKMISTVSLCKVCAASPRWLGSHSPLAKIRNSGLWQVNELYGDPLTAADLEYLRQTA